MSSVDYASLYSFYATPNIILPLLGGVLFDKIGTANAITLFAIFMTSGQALIAVGGYKTNFAMMQYGRALFGIGCESMYVGQSVVLSKWFINFEISFAMALSATIPLVASYLGGALFPKIYEDTDDFGYTMMIGFYTCAFSLLCVVLLAILDNATDKNDREVLRKYIEKERNDQ